MESTCTTPVEVWYDVTRGLMKPAVGSVSDVRKEVQVAVHRLLQVEFGHNDALDDTVFRVSERLGDDDVDVEVLLSMRYALTTCLRAVVGEALKELGIHRLDDITYRWSEVISKVQPKKAMVQDRYIRIGHCEGYEGIVRDIAHRLLP